MQQRGACSGAQGAVADANPGLEWTGALPRALEPR
jgi:hypothetical protein